MAVDPARLLAALHGAPPPGLHPGLPPVGPGGPGPGGPGGPPPGLLAAILQGAHPGGALAGPGPGPAPADSGGGDEQHALSLIRQMIQLGQQYIQVEPDAEDKATMAKVLAQLHQYEAKDQQDMAAAGGANPSVARLLRKNP